MALIFTDSFDHYASGDVLEKWSTVESTLNGQSISTGGGRRGTNGWTSSAATRGLVQAFGGQSTIISGVAINAGGPPSSTVSLFEYREASTVHLACRVNTDMSVSVVRGSTVLATSAGGVIPSSGYCFLEFNGTINDTTGAYEVRINGANVLSASNVDTRNGGTGVITNVSLIFIRAGMIVDDVYICDGTGTANNDFLGDVRIDAYFPNGNGNSSQLVGSDGNSVDNYLLIDDATPDDDTTYVQSATTGQKDTYAFPNMAHTPAAIYGVQVSMNARKDDAGLRSICSVTRSGGSDTDGATQALSTSYNYYRQILETDPNTSVAWTQSGVNSAEFGVKVAA